MATMLTGRQIREGRALLRWSTEQLAKRAEMGAATIARAERYETEAPITVAQARAIRSALETRGVTFAPEECDTAVAKLKDVHRLEQRHPKGTATVGFTNRRNQTVIRKTDRPGNNYRQTIYVLHCNDCGYDYGSNGSEIFRRRCPNHDGGKPGLEIGEPAGHLGQPVGRCGDQHGFDGPVEPRQASKPSAV